MLPILFQGHDLIIYSYPLFMGIGWGVAYQIFWAGLPTDVNRYLGQLTFWSLFIIAWIGAKAFFILTNPNEIDVNELSFWFGGGFVFYGGLIFGSAFITLLKFLRPNEFSPILAALLPALAIGHAIGRVGCFLAGCCYGKVTDFFWGIHQHGAHRHPTQLLEALGLGILAICLIKRRHSKKNLEYFYLIGYGTLRLMIELLRGDIVRGSWGGFSPSMVISVALVIVGIHLKIQEKSIT